MDKVLIILSDNNKARFISKAYSAAFKSLGYFVTERKIHDLNSDDIKRLKPDITFIFWSGMHQKDVIVNLCRNDSFESSLILNFAEISSDIPELFTQKENSFDFVFSDIEHNCIHSVNMNDYRSTFSKYNYGITFAGNPASENREKLLLKLIFNFGPINIFSRSFDFCKSVDEITEKKLADDFYIDLYRKSYKGFVDSQKELAAIYSSSRINIDISNESKFGLNYRIFEITASGGFLITPFSEDVSYFFDNGKDLETYSSEDELVDKIKFYLNNLNLAQAVALNGKRKTAGNHSAVDRLKKLLKVINVND